MEVCLKPPATSWLTASLPQDLRVILQAEHGQGSADAAQRLGHALQQELAAADRALIRAIL